MYKPSDIMALDGGFGVFSARSLAGKAISFRSVAIKLAEEDKADANFMDRSGYWLVGDEAVMQGRVARPSTDTRYYSSEEFRVMTLYALQQLGAKNVALATGLPVEHFSSLRQQHIENLKSFTKALPRESEFNIATVTVVPQAMGVLFSPGLKDWQGQPLDLSAGRVGILDMGDGTIDGAEAYNGKPNSKVKYGANKGASEIHRDILTGFANSKYKLGDDVTLHMIDRFLRDGEFFYKGESIPMDSLKFVREAKKKYLPEIDIAVKSMWGTSNTLRYLIATGGTAKLLGRELLETKIPAKQLVIPDNPGEANVLGFLEYLRKQLEAKKLIG